MKLYAVVQRYETDGNGNTDLDVEFPILGRVFVSRAEAIREAMKQRGDKPNKLTYVEFGDTYTHFCVDEMPYRIDHYETDTTRRKGTKEGVAAVIEAECYLQMRREDAAAKRRM